MLSQVSPLPHAGVRMRGCACLCVRMRGCVCAYVFIATRQEAAQSSEDQCVSGNWSVFLWSGTREPIKLNQAQRESPSKALLSSWGE